ncbi:amidohydrolase family protein [Zobellia galactanivorans]|uniref:Amidohydrolase family protein n=1 Tax=Zobellia galactanivorans (strain DSM 12802 / CCUG 47099 / CIP 106680 / NCIMB 13871 / Dsij) TaxID=63186 RepID=G0L7G8_ZOBGA|nr:amidohydrolase family protein [Zobellia galactanivorans]CAZ97415.1 Amidohydrolase family protein [Zobellia galactanivorans]
MKKNILSLLIILQAFSCKEKKEELNLTKGLYIANVTIISTEDGNYDPYVGHLVVEKDKIIYIDRKEPSISGIFEKLDGTGKFIVPGLIDSHVHITEVQGMLPHHMEKYPELTKEFNEQMPKSYLYYGFTTLINLGGISEEQIASFNLQPIKPDLYHTGNSGASVANGYPMNFAPEQYRFEAAPNFIFMESEADNIPVKFDPANHTPKAVVDRIKNSGAIAVKSYYESGFRGMSKLPVPTKRIMNELLDESHSNGLVLTVHGNSLEAHSFLAEVGVDVLAHGLWNWEKYKDVPVDSLPLEIRKTLDLQIQKQIGYTPTLTVIAGEEALAEDTFLNQPELTKVVPKKLLEWYKTEEGQWFAKDLFSEYNAEEVHEIYGNIQAHAMLALKYLSDNNALILFGTDTPSAPTYGNQPGHNGYWELKLMEEAGVPLNKILSSATINNAKVFHLDSSIGSLNKGKKANIVLLSKNPLKEIEAYNTIEKIIIGGKLTKREDLEAKK